MRTERTVKKNKDCIMEKNLRYSLSMSKSMSALKSLATMSLRLYLSAARLLVRGKYANSPNTSSSSSASISSGSISLSNGSFMLSTSLIGTESRCPALRLARTIKSDELLMECDRLSIAAFWVV